VGDANCFEPHLGKILAYFNNLMEAYQGGEEEE